jgi:hypothetical protein
MGYPDHRYNKQPLFEATGPEVYEILTEYQFQGFLTIRFVALGHRFLAMYHNEKE